MELDPCGPAAVDGSTGAQPDPRAGVPTPWAEAGDARRCCAS